MQQRAENEKGILTVTLIQKSFMDYDVSLFLPLSGEKLAEKKDKWMGR